ncbi:MAG: hypothetical protein ACJ8F3_11230 [Xanthobacteraceae bacterium]
MKLVQIVRNNFTCRDVALPRRHGVTQALLLQVALSALVGHRTITAVEANLVRRLGRGRVRLLRSGIFLPQHT